MEQLTPPDGGYYKPVQLAEISKFFVNTEKFKNHYARLAEPEWFAEQPESYARYLLIHGPFMINLGSPQLYLVDLISRKYTGYAESYIRNSKIFKSEKQKLREVKKLQKMFEGLLLLDDKTKNGELPSSVLDDAFPSLSFRLTVHSNFDMLKDLEKRLSLRQLIEFFARRTKHIKKLPGRMPAEKLNPRDKFIVRLLAEYDQFGAGDRGNSSEGTQNCALFLCAAYNPIAKLAGDKEFKILTDGGSPAAAITIRRIRKKYPDLGALEYLYGDG